MSPAVVVVCVLAELGLGAWLWRQARQLRRQQATVDRVRHRLAEARRVVRAREELETNRRRVEQTVDWTTASVETIHRAISDLSFDLCGRTNGPARTVHDRTSEHIYGGIRDVNKGVGRLLSGLLDPDDRDRRD